jgi:hypothetical protein
MHDDSHGNWVVMLPTSFLSVSFPLEIRFLECSFRCHLWNVLLSSVIIYVLVV